MTEFLARNSTLIVFGTLYVLVAVINHLPAPGDPRPVVQQMYGCFYETVRILANTAVQHNPKLAGASVTITPATETVITTPTTVTTSNPTAAPSK